MLLQNLNQMDSEFYYRLIGVVGFVIYMLSFTALQLRWINSENILYTLLNMIAAALVLLSLSVEWNLPSALIQTTWIGIGVIGLCRRWRKKAVEIAYARAAKHKAMV